MTTKQRVRCLLGICQTCGSRRTFFFTDQDDLVEAIKTAGWEEECENGLAHGWVLCEGCVDKKENQLGETA